MNSTGNFITISIEWLNGLFNSSMTNWLSGTPWINFDGNEITFNETNLNYTIQDLAEVRVFLSSLLVTTSGGSATATSANLDFEIKQIIVVPNSPTTKYRFEAVEALTGNIIDKDRTLHTGTWSIEKNYAINDAVNISITSANPDDTFNVTFKYLNNFD